MNQKKKLTYGPRDIDDVSWAFFLALRRLLLPLSRGPGVVVWCTRRHLLPPPSRGPGVVVVWYRCLVVYCIYI
jgi:hypothetical protein